MRIFTIIASTVILAACNSSPEGGEVPVAAPADEGKLPYGRNQSWPPQRFANKSGFILILLLEPTAFFLCT